MLLIGNCQLERLMFVLRVQGVQDVRYLANTSFLSEEFSAENVLNECARADLVVCQFIADQTNPLNYLAIKAANDNVVFVPYIFVDGIFSLSASESSMRKVYGQECIDSEVLASDPGAAIEGFKRGHLNFDNIGRLERSVFELKLREQSCDVVVSDLIESQVRERMIMITHNHPSAWLFDVYCRRLFKFLSLPYTDLSQLDRAKGVEYFFSSGASVFSPYDALALNCRFSHDYQWFNIGHSLLLALHSQLKMRKENI